MNGTVTEIEVSRPRSRSYLARVASAVSIRACSRVRLASAPSIHEWLDGSGYPHTNDSSPARAQMRDAKAPSAGPRWIIAARQQWRRLSVARLPRPSLLEGTKKERLPRSGRRSMGVARSD
jgi:hypothetical protein